MIGVGLNVGNLPVTEVHVGSTPVQAVYVGAKMVWSAPTVQITLDPQYEASYQLEEALAARGLTPQTVTEIPFDIELVGSGATYQMFNNFEALTHAPVMDTSQVTDMSYMFNRCMALTHVPDMNTRNVTSMSGMFFNCTSLTDGNVRLIGKHPEVITSNMRLLSGLTRDPFYDADGNPI